MDKEAIDNNEIFSEDELKMRLALPVLDILDNKKRNVSDLI
jgi:hypothetical protein